MSEFVVTMEEVKKVISVFHRNKETMAKNISRLMDEGYSNNIVDTNKMSIPYTYYRSFRKQYKGFETEIEYSGKGKNKVPVSFLVWCTKHRKTESVTGFLDLEET